MKNLILSFLVLVMFSCDLNTGKEEYYKEINKWKSERLSRLKSETGWLNLAGLFWLSEGRNTIGSDSTNSIIFPPEAPAFCGTIIKYGDRISFNADQSTEINLSGEPVSEAELKADDSGEPTLLKTGRYAWYIIKRGDQYGIRLRDYENRAITALDHIPSFDIDPEWRKKAEFVPFDIPDTISVETMIGGSEEYVVPGKLVFRAGGKKYELVPFRAGKRLFIIFGDLTSAVETYAAGRFLYTEGPDEKNNVVLDFNRAYNPPCAFTPFATCPLPPPENRLKLEVRAGEKAVHLE